MLKVSFHIKLINNIKYKIVCCFSCFLLYLIKFFSSRKNYHNRTSKLFSHFSRIFKKMIGKFKIFLTSLRGEESSAERSVKAAVRWIVYEARRIKKKKLHFSVIEHWMYLNKWFELFDRKFCPSTDFKLGLRYIESKSMWFIYLQKIFDSDFKFLFSSHKKKLSFSVSSTAPTRTSVDVNTMNLFHFTKFFLSLLDSFTEHIQSQFSDYFHVDSLHQFRNSIQH